MTPEPACTLRALAAEDVACIRPFLDELAAHHNAVSPHFAGTYPTYPVGKLLDEYTASLASGKGRAVLACRDNMPVGFCLIEQAGGRGYLEELVVTGTHRGEGIGSALMDWALAEFERAGITNIELMVVEGNEGAMRFYERYGFLPATRIMRRPCTDKASA